MSDVRSGNSGPRCPTCSADVVAHTDSLGTHYVPIVNDHEVCEKVIKTAEAEIERQRVRNELLSRSALAFPDAVERAERAEAETHRLLGMYDRSEDERRELLRVLDEAYQAVEMMAHGTFSGKEVDVLKRILGTVDPDWTPEIEAREAFGPQGASMSALSEQVLALKDVADFLRREDQCEKGRCAFCEGADAVDNAMHLRTLMEAMVKGQEEYGTYSERDWLAGVKQILENTS